MVEIAKSRSPPSFSAYEVRSFIGHCGHGVRSSGRFSGGSPSTSIWVTEAAFSRSALATQSAPVSPPPITITCLPAAVIGARQTRRELAGRADLVRDHPGAVVEVVHRKVDAVELAARHRQVARHARPGRDDDRVVRGPQLVGADVHPDVDAVADLDALGDELVEAPLDEPLLDLELGHAEPHEAAARLVALEHGDGVPGPGELLRAREPGRAGADHGDRAAGAMRPAAAARSSPPPRPGRRSRARSA